MTAENTTPNEKENVAESTASLLSIDAIPQGDDATVEVNQKVDLVTLHVSNGSVSSHLVLTRSEAMALVDDIESVLEELPESNE